MRRLLLGLTLPLALSLALLARAEDGKPARDLAFKNVRVFDGDKVLPEANVVVRGEQIAAVGKDAAIPAGAEVVDGTGLTLLPGLIDAHTHVWDAGHLEQALVFGVTTELDMLTSPKLAAELREQCKKDGRLADLLSAGNAVTCPKGHGTEYGLSLETIEKPEEAKDFIDRRIAEGSDYIKVIYDTSIKAFGMPTISKEVLRATIKAAHDRKKIAVVHIGAQSDARDAIEAGADGLAHLFVGSSPEKDFASFTAEHKAFVVPTLSVLSVVTGKGAGPKLAKDKELAPYLASATIANLKTSFGFARAEYGPVEETVKQLEEAKVPILAGTDCPNPGTAHGISMHGELSLLVKAGLTPVEALASATSVPARSFKLDDRGRIAPGARADLLLVKGDPTTEIAATRHIVSVYKRGVALDRKAYLAKVEAERAQAAKPPAGSESGGVSDFEDGKLSARFGSWSPSTDEIRGGKSTVKLDIQDGGANGTKHSLKISGEVKEGFPFPWAGAMFYPGVAPMSPANLSAWKELAFHARGDGKECRIMLFAESKGPRPAIVTFTPGDDWKEFSFPFAKFDEELDGHDITGIAVVSGSAAGEFRFELDEIRLR